MYLEHFGLLEPPFRITPHTEYFFSGANRGETLEALLYAITNDEGIVKVTGEVGSGKTMLCRMLIERLPQNVETVYLANPSFSRDEILLALLDDLDCPLASNQRSSLVIKVLQEHLIGRYADRRRVVLLIDEAHAMPEETLDEIRLLSNLESNRHKLLQIVLFGQQELNDNLRTNLLRPLRERITHSFELEPLVHADVGQYLMFRMRQAGYRGPDLFDRSALKLIAKSSEGLTRRLNILADKCLLAAFAEGEHGITRKHAVAAINDSGFAPLTPRAKGAFPSLRRNWITLLVAIALVAGGVVAGTIIPSFRASSSAPTPTKIPARQTPSSDVPASPRFGSSSSVAAPVSPATAIVTPDRPPIQTSFVQLNVYHAARPIPMPQPTFSGHTHESGVSQPSTRGATQLATITGSPPPEVASRSGTSNSEIAQGPISSDFRSEGRLLSRDD